jgi:hypothetical protein
LPFPRYRSHGVHDELSLRQGSSSRCGLAE